MSAGLSAGTECNGSKGRSAIWGRQGQCAVKVGVGLRCDGNVKICSAPGCGSLDKVGVIHQSQVEVISRASPAEAFDIESAAE